MTVEEIQSQLIKIDDPTLPESFIAAAVQISEDGTAKHAGIGIRHNGTSYLCHYYGEVLIDESPKDNWYYQKEMLFIEGMFTASFLTHCLLIQEKANPKYAFFYCGGFYQDGNYFSDIPTKEYMTCVGFCLNVIKGFIEEEFINYSDWDITSIELPEHKEYLENFIKHLKKKYPPAEVDLIMKNIRRIAPEEYIASAFMSSLPISKSQIDKIVAEVRGALLSKLN